MKNKYIIALLILMTAGTSVFAQSDLKAANRFYENYDYFFAIESYNKYIENHGKDAVTQEIARRLADSYRLTGNSREAEAWYARSLALPGPENTSIFYYAEALKSNGKYKEAKTQYELYSTKATAQEQPKLRVLIKGCEKSIDWVAHPQPVLWRNERQLNTPAAEFSPVITAGLMTFTSDRLVDKNGIAVSKKDEEPGKEVYGWTGNSYLKLYTAGIINDSSFNAANALNEEINTRYHNGTSTYSPDGNTIFFTRTKMVRKNATGNADPTSWGEKDAEPNDYVNRLEIYYATKQDGDWKDVTAFPYNNLNQYSVGHPAMSPDGKYLYYVSDMLGGYGETDIYYSEKLGDTSWGKPVNLGPEVNTAGKEGFPSFDKSGMLYFASTGQVGMGGYDLFSAHGAAAEWKYVTNLKHPVNSPKDDIGIVFDETGMKGYLASNREGGSGSDDIYGFRYTSKDPTFLILKGLAVELVSAALKLETPLDSVLVLVSNQEDTTRRIVYSNKKGEFITDLRYGDRYEIKGFKDGFFTKTANIKAYKTGKSDTITVKLVFEKICIDKPYLLENLDMGDDFEAQNIYYDLDKAVIRPDAARVLDQLVQILIDNPTIQIELSSHTDARHSHDYNQRLSQRRAESAVRYIVSRGIAKDRITAKGYGETRLVNKCRDGVQCTEEMHQQNRRTEFTVTGFIK
jgi:outer membrane protein OmpA-like peptidoglycan-associated protein/tetratricopeptide (TPR) repeat protein